MNAREPTQGELSDFVRANVHYCVSSLVYTLAQGYGCIQSYTENGSGNGSDLVDLTEQAFELSTALPDYEEAAKDYCCGLTREECEEELDALGIEVADSEDTSTLREAVEANIEDGTIDAQEFCERYDREPYDREVYEHWIVDGWFADRLEEHGEKVDRDFAGLTVWARTTTGQAIMMDGVVADIWRALHADDTIQTDAI